MIKKIKQFITLIFVSTFFVATVSAFDSREEGAEIVSIPALDCVIEPSQIVDVGSAVPGVVDAILADRSDLVKKGAIIAQIESSVERAALKQAKMRAGLETAIQLRQETAEFGRLTQSRNQTLLKKLAISVQDMDQLKTETRIAELQVRQEKENKRLAELDLLRAESVLEQRTIRSPVDGVVMERYKYAGEYVSDEPVLRIAQLDPLHVEVIVPVTYMGRVKTGMQAQVASSAPGSDAYIATVIRVDRVADAASGTYGVRLSLSNPDYSVPAGMRCELSFLPEQKIEKIASRLGTLSKQELEIDG
ncbi:MAG: efflux transporter periplasmic adaptor subunit [Gammaproteobacteria bacterium]|nr:MAG: efflux transporter periplasmic adaptor subunit [Gammaproteobacteria bacterium]